MKITRDTRQIEGLNKWEANGYSGVAVYPTGFGKTYTAIRGVKGLVKRVGLKSTGVIVPTINLKNQWEEQIKIHKLQNIEVMVINTAIKSTHDYELLILDEIHRYAADTFRQIFKRCSYDYILGLTATLEREDGLHEIILEYLKVIDEITVQEALDNGWISPYKVYNVAVPFTSEDRTAYNKADNSFKHLAATMGYGGQAFKVAQSWINSPDKDKQGKAARYYNAMRTRKKICINNVNKIDITKRIVDCFPDRNGLIFSSTTEFADSLQETLGDISLTFHSKLSKKNQEYVLKRFKDKRTKVRLLSSVKALNEGFNVPECSLGIIAGSNGTKRTFIQQLGRVVRYLPDKEAIFINLYTPDTQEEVWVRKRLDSVPEDSIIKMTIEQFEQKFKI